MKRPDLNSTIPLRTKHDTVWTNCAYCGRRLSADHVHGYCDTSCQDSMRDPRLTASTQPFIPEDSVYNGVYEDIAWNPITITGGKKELAKVCREHGVMAKSLIKSKSQGKGYEMRT